jgi:hypothetical protein
LLAAAIREQVIRATVSGFKECDIVRCTVAIPIVDKYSSTEWNVYKEE